MSSEPKNKGGRPTLPDDQRKVQRSIRLLPKHWDKIDAAGTDELEKLLDRWKPKTPPDKG